MKKRNLLLFYALLFLGFVGIIGCATIIHGTRQGISISSTPSGASVTIDGRIEGKTPLMVDLSRKDRHLVKIELESCNSYEMYLNRSASGWVWGNIVFGGIPGLIIDAITGGLYKLTPEQVSAVLGKKSVYLLKKDTIFITTVLSHDSSWEKIGNLKLK
ncbi:MAG: PEGA domain-containing protein [bacterium]